MKKKKDPNKEFIEEVQKSMSAGKVHTLTEEQRKVADLEIKERRRKAFLQSMILSTLMLYNLDELHELKATEFRLKKAGKEYHKELEKYINDVFDIANDTHAAEYIRGATDIITKMLEEYTASDDKN